jgi:tRNA nucleotidyltransferase (CCA-adding enzyme)
VRDRLLGKKTLDIDLACEGNVQRLGERLAKELGARFLYYPPFKTGTIEGPKGERIDIARTRRESYPKPGELPKIKPSSIEEDLFRRDFTINAMAQSLDPEDFGNLLDPLKGQRDLKKRLIRVLHDKSFTDDPTRIFRAVRYAARLGFRIKPHTSVLLKKAVKRIPALSGERLLYELRCIAWEPKEVRVMTIKRLESLGALGFLGRPLAPLSPTRLGGIKESCEFLCLFLSHFDNSRIRKLPLSKECFKTIDTLQEKKPILSRLGRLSKPSQITLYLNNYDQSGLEIIAETTRAKSCERITRYLEDYSNVKISTTGEDLKRMGIQPGPRYKELLDNLLAAKLDARVRNKREEQALLGRWLREK